MLQRGVHVVTAGIELLCCLLRQDTTTVDDRKYVELTTKDIHFQAIFLKTSLQMHIFSVIHFGTRFVNVAAAISAVADVVCPVCTCNGSTTLYYLWYSCLTSFLSHESKVKVRVGDYEYYVLRITAVYRLQSEANVELL